jgi:pimeloyl-ACP methyl ester carboxylesterase
MIQPTSNYLCCEGRELHYMDWNTSSGQLDGRTVIAWHGLARTGRDMDELAAHLSANGYRVICPDTLGRGLSQWSPDPRQEYCLAFYAKLAVALADQLGLGQFDWVGTSMGGAIGMVCAAGPLKARITRLVLNDIGTELAEAAEQRIRGYAGNPPAFDTVSELEAYFRTIYKPYGWIGDTQWRRMTETSVRRLPDGRVTPHYDPAMAQQFTNHPDDYKLHEAYARIDVPVLLLRGESSDLLLPETVESMRKTGPGLAGRLQVIEVPGCGHAPALNVPDQLGTVLKFLRG